MTPNPVADIAPRLRTQIWDRVITPLVEINKDLAFLASMHESHPEYDPLIRHTLENILERLDDAIGELEDVNRDLKDSAAPRSAEEDAL